MMTLARTTPGYPTAMPVSPTMAPMRPMAPTTTIPPRITRPFHSLDMISSPVWLGIKVVNKNSTEFLRYDRN